jgi:hypothetical protein
LVSAGVSGGGDILDGDDVLPFSSLTQLGFMPTRKQVRSLHDWQRLRVILVIWGSML